MDGQNNFRLSEIKVTFEPVIRPTFEFHHQMLFRIFILMCLAMLCSTLSQAQNTASTDTTTVKKPPSEVTEEVDGLFAFAGYLGKKIYNEVSDQFDEGEPEEKAEIKRVRIKLGPIKIERIEKR